MRSIYFWLFWVFIAALGLFSSCGERGLLQCGVQAPNCATALVAGLWLQGMAASGVAAQWLSSCGSRALEQGLSSCGAWTELLCNVWVLPGSEIQPVSPALASGFFTTEPPWRSIHTFFFNMLFHYSLSQDIEYSSPCCTVGPCCLSILWIIANIC